MIVPFDDEADAIALANDTSYGLAAAIWYADEARARAIARQVRAGRIRINGSRVNQRAPRGGFKTSTVAQLREHYAAGRLSLDKFQDRLYAVYGAQTTRELGMVTDSLPHKGVVISSEALWDSYPGGYPLNVAEMRAAMARAGRRITSAFGVVTSGSLLVLTLLNALTCRNDPY